MPSVISLAQGIKDNNEFISRRVQLIAITVQREESLKPLHDDPTYQQELKAYDVLFDELFKRTLSHDQTKLKEIVSEIREQAIKFADHIVKFMTDNKIEDFTFGLARINMLYPRHPLNNCGV